MEQETLLTIGTHSLAMLGESELFTVIDNLTGAVLLATQSYLEAEGALYEWENERFVRWTD